MISLYLYICQNLRFLLMLLKKWIDSFPPIYVFYLFLVVSIHWYKSNKVFIKTTFIYNKIIKGKYLFICESRIPLVFIAVWIELHKMTSWDRTWRDEISHGTIQIVLILIFGLFLEKQTRVTQDKWQSWTQSSKVYSAQW